MHPEGFSGELRPTSRDRIEEFAERLRDEDVTVLVRDTQGDEIAAACGQLAGMVIDNNG
jgi:23S rRNA (adenine2503-C2)-methyltransferase